MAFVYPAILGGIILVGIPVLLHLIMQQKPKRLLFPAVRFLLQTQRTNQRRLRLRHLLLLAMRMLLIAAICLALARPKVANERLNLTADRPVAAVLVFDTSYSMEYSVAGHTRLDEAKKRSLEFIAGLPDGSRFAVFDSAETGGEWLPSLSAACDRINALELKPNNYPVTNQLTSAYELLWKLEEETDNADELPLRFVYVFSDRTDGSWNARQVPQLQRLRDRISPPGAPAVLVDVGVKDPANVAITHLHLPQQVVPANRPVTIEATVYAQGTRCNTEIFCRVDGKDLIGKEPVTLEPGQRRVFSFKAKGLTPGLHQAEVALASKDALPFAGIRYASFEVQGPRNLLIVADDVREAWVLRTALEAENAFKCDVKSTDDVRAHSPQDLGAYKAICLLGLARPDAELWEKLGKRYVRDGGGLAIIPGGNNTDTDAYKSPAAQILMPGELVKVVEAPTPAGAIWSAATYKHPVMAPFGEWSRTENVEFFVPGREPAAFRYWEVTERPNNESDVVVTYDDKRPALLERHFDPKQNMRGRVLLFTTPLGYSQVWGTDVDGKVQPRWNNYLQNTSFYLVLARITLGYLAGDTQGGNFNYLCGQTIPVALPSEPRFPTYTVQGPGLGSSDAIVTRAENQNELAITKAVMPGNFRFYGADGKPMADFSLNVPPEESQLTQVPAEQIESLFGPNSIVPLDQKSTLQDALQSHWSQPVELLPWLMILVLVLLALENLLANKFYRREPQTDEA